MHSRTASTVSITWACFAAGMSRISWMSFFSLPVSGTRSSSDSNEYRRLEHFISSAAEMFLSVQMSGHWLRHIMAENVFSLIPASGQNVFLFTPFALTACFTLFQKPFVNSSFVIFPSRKQFPVSESTICSIYRLDCVVWNFCLPAADRFEFENAIILKQGSMLFHFLAGAKIIE